MLLCFARLLIDIIISLFFFLFFLCSVQLAMEVAPCKPFSNMVDTAEIITCSFLVDSMVIILERQKKTVTGTGIEMFEMTRIID